MFTTATIMATIRWHEDAHLFAIAVVAFGLGLYGYRARRRHRRGWPLHHAIGMGGSYIALLTGFYVDNGPFLPVWNRLPSTTYWLLPTLCCGAATDVSPEARRTVTNKPPFDYFSEGPLYAPRPRSYLAPTAARARRLALLRIRHGYSLLTPAADQEAARCDDICPRQASPASPTTPLATFSSTG
jgi:hypothetical protein